MSVFTQLTRALSGRGNDRQSFAVPQLRNDTFYLIALGDVNEFEELVTVFIRAFDFKLDLLVLTTMRASLLELHVSSSLGKRVNQRHKPLMYDPVYA